MEITAMESNLRIKGQIEIIVKGEDYEISHVFPNLITSFGLAFLAQLVADPLSFDYESYIAVGTGTTAPTEGDTALEAEVARGLAQRARLSGADSNKVQFQTIFGRGVVVGDITEAGIFDADAGGNMFNRSTFTAIPVTADQALLINWQIIFQNTTA
jgi:hypothetical protein